MPTEKQTGLLFSYSFHKVYRFCNYMNNFRNHIINYTYNSYYEKVKQVSIVIKS